MKMNLMAVALVALTGCSNSNQSDGGPNPTCSAHCDEGCSDGTREAFLDAGTWPALAGCQATWSVTFSADGGSGSPVAACSAGWHLCSQDEVTARAAPEDCAAQPGVFAAFGLNVEGQNITCPQGPCHGIYDYQCGDTFIGPNDTDLHYGACGVDAVACTTYGTLQVCTPNRMCGPDGAFSWDGTNSDAGAPGRPRGVLCCR
jgi:hypothetical protein